MLEVKTIPVGMLGTNCYLAWRPELQELYIIDPGADATAIIRAAKEFSWNRVVVLLTHAHVDHISALSEVVRALGVETVYLNPGDAALYASPDNALEPYVPAARDLPGTTSSFAAEGLEIIATPGHSRGGSCFYFPTDGVLFSGDTLFAGSVGRTDFPGGSWPELERSIREKLLTLPESTRVYPGHGEPTRIKFERNNPYLR